MKKKQQRNFCIALCALASFALWTVLVRTVDVRAIGPRGSSVGFSTINASVHRLTGVHMSLYHITDWLGLVPVFVGFGFAILGLIQWIKRKNLFKVDFSILALGVFYVAVIAVYLFFEEYVINYRPILINGILEASYPSSTTVLVTCVMPTAAMQLDQRIKNGRLRRVIKVAIFAFVIFMVVGRLLSGVHWITDIIGGALVSAGLVMTYRSLCETI